MIHSISMALSMDQNPGSSVLGLLERFIERDSARLGGVPVFRGTRVPVKSIFDHLEAGDSLNLFLEDFPGVTREQAQAVITIAGRHLFDEAKIA